MGRSKKIKDEDIPGATETTLRLAPVRIEFVEHADLPTLKEKINEIINHLNG